MASVPVGHAQATAKAVPRLGRQQLLAVQPRCQWAMRCKSQFAASQLRAAWSVHTAAQVWRCRTGPPALNLAVHQAPQRCREHSGKSPLRWKHHPKPRPNQGPKKLARARVEDQIAHSKMPGCEWSPHRHCQPPSAQHRWQLQLPRRRWSRPVCDPDPTGCWPFRIALNQ